MEEKGDIYGHPRGFSAVVFSPDGKHLATAGLDGLVRLWDAAAGAEQRRIVMSSGGARSLAFTGDGQTLAVGGAAIRLFDVNTGKEQLAQFGKVASAYSAAVAPDGRTIFTGAEGHIQCWDAATGRPGKRLVGHDGNVRTLHMSTDGARLVSADTDKTVRVWDLRTGKEQRRMDAPNAGKRPFAVTNDGNLAALTQDDQSIRVIELASGKERGHVAAVKAPVVGVAFAPDGRSLVLEQAGTAECRALLQQLADGAPGAQLTEEATASLRRLAAR